MNIKHCNAIVIEENGTREVFCEGDIVCVEYTENLPAILRPKRVKVTGRIRRFYNGVVWRDWRSRRFYNGVVWRDWDVPVFGSNLILDISTEYHENKIEINLDRITSIKKEV